jgi:sirohydrochlorin cobaltochelatase
MREGLVLFAHGARDARWAEPFQAILARVRSNTEVPVELAFLELMAPDFVTAVDLLASQGCDRIKVVPLFLGQGAHLRRDLPDLINRAREKHPALGISAVDAVGENPAVLEALARYCIDSAGGRA